MRLVIDAGNTTIGVGLFANDKLVKSISVRKELCESLSTFFKENKEQIDDIVYSSVTPHMDDKLLLDIKKNSSCRILLVNQKLKFGFDFKQYENIQIGADLLADLEAGIHKYETPMLICDLGTASKILCIDKDGKFSSCAIIPGMELSGKSLMKNAELLPEIGLNVPKSALGKNTVEAMNIGIVLGHAYLISGLASRFEKELGYKCRKILTGGTGTLLQEELAKDGFIYDANLCLEGLNIIGNMN